MLHMKTFKADICQLISCTLCQSSEMLDASLRLVTEKQTHVRSCRVPSNQNDPWYKAVKSDIIAAKNIGIRQNFST